MRAWRHIGLASDDWFDSGVGGFLVKFDRAKEIAVVGYGHGRHLILGRFFHQLPRPDRTVEQRIFSMEVEVNERIARHR